MIEGISEANNPTNTKSEASLPKGGGEVSREKILNIVLLIMVFVMIGLFGYLFFTDRLIVGVANPFSKDSAGSDKVIENGNTNEGDDSSIIEEDSEDTESDVIDVEQEVEDKQVTTVEYSNEEVGITLQYPTDWRISKETLTGEEGSYSLLLDITSKTSSKWTFSYSFPSASGPSLCRYTDSDQDFSEISEYIEFNSYSIIPNSSATFRRSLASDFTKYTVCKKESSTDFFSTWVEPGFVTYLVDSSDSRNTKMLAILDEILLSLESTSE